MTPTLDDDTLHGDCIATALGINAADPNHLLAHVLVRADSELLDGLVQVREARGLTLDAVAGLMGVTTDAVSQIESGARDSHASTLRRYAWAVGARVTHTVTADGAVTR